MRSIRIMAAAAVLVGMTTATFAQEDEIGINVGLTSLHNNDSINPKNISGGVTYQFNEINDFGLKPRVDVDYVRTTDYKTVNALVKGSINAVYEFGRDNVVSPHILAGVGYEHVDGALDHEFEDHMFIQTGAGVTYHQEDGYNFKLEGRLVDISSSNKNEDNEVVLTAGVSAPLSKFRKTEKKDENTCPKKIDAPDEDRDGVADVIDQCPGTPCYFTVDQYGCPIKATLRIHFDVDKATIRPYSLPKVERFATFLMGNRGTMVKIIGHTDSDASDAYNMVLSEKRAKAVLNKLVELGVSPNRLSAEGKGERMPIASNATKSGKSLNRRIEVELTYPANVIQAREHATK